MARTLDEIIASLAPEYDPERKLVSEQIAAVPGQEGAAVGALEAAKTNAFSDITDAANSRGMLYSGVPIDEQSRYVGERYMPALAAVKQGSADKLTKLQAGLLDINKEQRTKAQGIRDDEVAMDRKAAAEAAQMQLEREKIAAQNARSTSRAAAKAPSKTQIQSELNSDLAAAFNNFNLRPRGYTESVIIKQLIAAYPELSATEVSKQVYAYRKALGYG